MNDTTRKKRLERRAYVEMRQICQRLSVPDVDVIVVSGEYAFIDISAPKGIVDYVWINLPSWQPEFGLDWTLAHELAHWKQVYEELGDDPWEIESEEAQDYADCIAQQITGMTRKDLVESGWYANEERLLRGEHEPLP